MDIIAGIAAATEGLKVVNELRKIDKELDKAELKLRLVDLADKLLDAKHALQDAQERDFSQRTNIQNLEKALQQRGRLDDVDGLLFELTDDGNRIGAPYCNQCYVKENRFFRLIFGPFMLASHKCSNCDGLYGSRDRHYEAEQTSAQSAKLRKLGEDLA